MHDFDFLQGKDLQIDSLSLSGVNKQLDISVTGHLENDTFSILFENVSSLSVQELSYPMYLEGFEIIDNSYRGWSDDVRYYVHDLEDDHIRFHCQSISFFAKLDL